MAPPLVLVIFSCFCIIGTYSSYHAAAATGKDTITQGQELKDFDFLVSPNGFFKLGFFSPDASKYRYLGIWFTIMGTKVVWVANRDAPIIDSSGVLTIDGDGKLKLTYGRANSIMWNSNQSTTPTGNVTAKLLDSGNFVLRGEETSNKSATRQKVLLWQSFDYPTNVLLPGMKLGFNSKTGQNWSLTSWLSNDVPAPGAFTLGGNPNGTNQLLLWRRGQVYWASGVLNGQISDPVPFLDELSYVSNKDEKYFTYLAKNDRSSLMSIMVVESNGIIFHYEYVDANSYLLTEIIYCDRNENHPSPGCVGEAEKQWECRRGYKSFLRRNGIMSGDPYEMDEDPGVGISDCEAKCWSNCTCAAYANVNVNGTGCQLWSREFSFGADDGIQNEIYILHANSRNGKKWWLWFVIAVAATIVMLFMGFLCYLRRRYFKSKGSLS